MKILLLPILSFIFLSAFFVEAQDMERMPDHRKKLDQLEKIKLIESLDLNEEASARFFARRNEMNNEIDDLESRHLDLINQLEASLNDDGKETKDKQNRLVGDILKLRDQIHNTRQNFILSLNDILTPEQVAKYIVFEMKFREEIKRVLFRGKKRPDR